MPEESSRYLDNNVESLDKYREDRVYPGATGDKNQVRVAFSAGVLEEIVSLIMKSHVHPELDTPHKYIRNAVIHQLHRDRMKIEDDDTRRHLDFVLGMLDVERANQEQDNFNRHLEELKRGLVDARNQQDDQLLKLRVQDAVMNAMRAPYRSWQDAIRRMVSEFYSV